MSSFVPWLADINPDVPLITCSKWGGGGEHDDFPHWQAVKAAVSRGTIGVRIDRATIFNLDKLER